MDPGRRELRSVGKAPPSPPAPAREDGDGLLWRWVLPLLLVALVNLATRGLAGDEAPLRPLLFYGVAMGLLLLLSERLRATLPRAQVVVIMVAALWVIGARRADLSSGRVALAEVTGEAVRLGTGLGRGVGEALRVGALGDSDLGAYRRYLDRMDSRSSEIVILASHLAAGCESADHLCESSAVVRFVTDEVAYRADPRGGEDYIKGPQETLAAGAGDCEDKSLLMASLLEALGNRTWLVFTRDHVWPLVCFNEPLPDLWRKRTSRLDGDGREAYARLLGPRSGESLPAAELARQIEAADEIEIDDRACYAVEPTAPGSWFGARHEVRDYLVAVDPVTRCRIDLMRLMRLPRLPPSAAPAGDAVRR